MTRLLDEKQAADALGVSVTFLRKSRCYPDVVQGPPHIKLGRSVRYDPEDLRAFVDAHRRGATHPAA